MKQSDVLTTQDLVILKALYVTKVSIQDVTACYPVDQAYIGKLLRRPHVVEFVQDLEVALTAEYAGLEAEAIKVIREALTSEKASIKLLAADKLLRVLGRFKDSPTVKIEANEVHYVSSVGVDGGITTRPSREEA